LRTQQTRLLAPNKWVHANFCTRAKNPGCKEGLLCFLCLIERSKMFNKKNPQHQIQLQSIHTKRVLNVLIQRFA